MIVLIIAVAGIIASVSLAVTLAVIEVRRSFRLVRQAERSHLRRTHGV